MDMLEKALREEALYGQGLKDAREAVIAARNALAKFAPRVRKAKATGNSGSQK